VSFSIALDNPDQTTRVAIALGRALKAGDSVGLRGDLGAGKTHFVQGVARGLELPPEVRVTSPTFTLLNEYRGGRLTLYHADLYRIEKANELPNIGIDHALGQNGVVMIEWSDRFPVLPEDALELSLEVTGDTSRRLTVRANGPRSQALVLALTPCLSPRAS
jgi:tRNA threonylcarbamoyladenosine biosynthesis protein TsaE